MPIISIFFISVVIYNLFQHFRVFTKKN